MKHLPAAGRSSGAAALLERDAALAAIDLVLMRARGGSGELLLVEGHAGIGKSALLEAAVTRARGDGMTVLRARASGLESDFQFGIALRLFEPLLAGADDEAHDRLLAGSAALAGPLLERPTSWAGTAGDAASIRSRTGCFACWPTSPSPARCSSRSTTCTGPTAPRCASSSTCWGAWTRWPSRSSSPAASASRARPTTCWPRSPRTRPAGPCARRRSRATARGGWSPRRCTAPTRRSATPAGG